MDNFGKVVAPAGAFLLPEDDYESDDSWDSWDASGGFGLYAPEDPSISGCASCGLGAAAGTGKGGGFPWKAVGFGALGLGLGIGAVILIRKWL